MNYRDISPWIYDNMPPWIKFISPESCVHFKRYQTILRQGDHPTKVYFLEYGRVQLSMVSMQGNEKILMFAKGGAIFGEHPVFDGLPLQYSASALTDCRIYSMPTSLFLKYLSLDSNFHFWVTRMLVQKERELVTQIALLSFSDALHRIAYDLLYSADVYGVLTHKGIRIDLPITHQDLGHRAGATRATVSSAIKYLVTQNIIRIEKRRFFICNMDGLKKIALDNLNSEPIQKIKNK